MKIPNLILKLTLFLAVLCITGCSSTSYKKADTAANSLQTAASEVNAENGSIDTVLAALNDLLNKPSIDLKPQFKQFSATLERLEDAAGRAEKAAEHASHRNAEYLKSWDKELAAINFEAIHNQSLARKTQVSDEFNTVNTRYRENQAVVDPLIIYLQDIRTALGADLTAAGIESVKPLAANAEQNARKVQTALAKLAGDLAVSGSKMSSIVTQNLEPMGGSASIAAEIRGEAKR